MKQMFTLLLALLAFSVLFAQRNDGYPNNRNTSLNNNGHYNNEEVNEQRPQQAVNWQPGDSRWQDAGQMNNNDQHIATNEIYNGYDRRHDDYGSNRGTDRWQHYRGDERTRRERANNLTALGGGLVLGGVLGVLLSAHR